MILSLHLLETLITIIIVSITTGIISCFLLVQQKSLFADTIAHATLPGLTLCFYLTLTSHNSILLAAALCSCLVAAGAIRYLETSTIFHSDTVLGIVLATSFGFGSFLLSKIQTLDNAHHVGISKYLLGNAATMLHEEMIISITVSLIVIAICWVVHHRYIALIFDPVHAHTINISKTKLAVLMFVIIAITILIGLTSMGIILISSLLINPAASAYQWTKNIYRMIPLSIIFCMISSSAGTIISYHAAHIPTGSTITIIATIITFISLLAAPQGLIMNAYHQYQQKRQIDAFEMLSNFLLFTEGIDRPNHPHNIAALDAIGKKGSQRLLNILIKQGFISSTQPNFYHLTEKGIQFLRQRKKIC